MSLRNPIQELEYDTPRGVDTTTPVAAVKPGFVRQALNVDPGYDGGYTKRQGYTNRLTSAVWDTNKIQYGIEFRTTSGIERVVVFGTDSTASGGEYGYVDSGSISVISTSLSGTTRPVLTQFDELLFFYNGVDDPEVYDGSATRQVGITAPATAPNTFTQNTSGDLTQLGSYVYAYTYYNSITRAESSPSPFSTSQTLTGTNDAFMFNIAAGDSSTADTIRVWRTYANTAGPLFLDGTTSIASTTYTSTIADAGLGQQMELDNSRITDLTDNAKYATNIANRIFVKAGANEIRWSKIGQEGPMPESFEVKATTRTISKFGSADDVVGIASISQLPIILKDKSIGRLEQVGIPDNTLSFDNVLYEYKEISDAHGCVSHWATCQVENELIFMARDNIYATDGLKVRPIGDAIRATLKTLGFSSTQKPRISAINDIENSQVRFSVFSTPTANNPDFLIVGDYDFYPEFRWTFYSAGEDPVTHPGIKADSLFKVTNSSSGALDVWFGNSVGNGKLYRMNDGNNDDGLGIYMKLVTRPYSGDSPLKDKLYKLSQIQAKGDGSDYDLTVCAIYDVSGTEEECLGLNLSSGGYLYDAVDAIYDTATYSDESIQALDYNLHRRAKFMQLIFKQTEADAPIDLFGWGVASSAMGLKGE